MRLGIKANATVAISSTPRRDASKALTIDYEINAVNPVSAYNAKD